MCRLKINARRELECAWKLPSKDECLEMLVYWRVTLLRGGFQVLTQIATLESRGRNASAQKRLCAALVSVWFLDLNAGASTSWWPEKTSDPRLYSRRPPLRLGTVDAADDFSRLRKNRQLEDARWPGVRTWHKVAFMPPRLQIFHKGHFDVR